VTELAFALVAQGALLALILIAMESRYPLANRFLAGLLVTLSVPLLARVLLIRLGGEEWIGLFYNTTFLIGPCFYFYTLALTNRSLALRGGHLLHAVPALATTIIAFGTGLDRVSTEPAFIRLVATFGLLNALSLTAYSIAALRQLTGYRRALLDQYSAIERISLDWLKILAVIVLTSGIAIALLNCARLVSGLPSSATAIILVPFSLVVFYAVAILGFRQSSVLLIGARPDLSADTDAVVSAGLVEEEEAADRDIKYERSGLDDSRAQRIWARLEILMSTDSPYLDSELQLSTLAEQLGVSPQTLSEVLGRIAGNRFYDYINGLRVERARQLLRDPASAETSILDIALAAGFKSKSTFNKYFKQEVGQTPTAYRQLPAGQDSSAP
jgi:AraC-like DNA-binding protein